MQIDKKNLYVIIGVVCVFLACIVAWYIFIYRDVLEVTHEDIGTETPLEVKVPDEWNKNGDIQIPGNIEAPSMAVEKVESIPGYAKEEIKSAEAIQGNSGEWYWAVKTDKGYVTVEGETQ